MGVGFVATGVGFDATAWGFDAAGVGFDATSVGFDASGGGFDAAGVGLEALVVAVGSSIPVGSVVGSAVAAFELSPPVSSASEHAPSKVSAATQ